MFWLDFVFVVLLFSLKDPQMAQNWLLESVISIGWNPGSFEDTAKRGHLSEIKKAISRTLTQPDTSAKLGQAESFNHF